MLSSRSARLAAGLLLALLAGWLVRWQRLRHAPHSLHTQPPPAEAIEESTKNSFPEE